MKELFSSLKLFIISKFKYILSFLTTHKAEIAYGIMSMVLLYAIYLMITEDDWYY